jgi:hypothetical protein
VSRDSKQAPPPEGVRFIKPPNLFKQKVGTGGIDEKLLEKSQKFIETVELDFVPYANQFLKQITERTEAAKKSNDNFVTKRDSLAGPVMQLKANGGMFQFQLVSDVADIALQFLDSIEDMNDEAYEVITAHKDTIKVIIANNLRGDGGREGYALVKELDRVCKRYFSKYKKKQ